MGMAQDGPGAWPEWSGGVARGVVGSGSPEPGSFLLFPPQWFESPESPALSGLQSNSRRDPQSGPT